MPNLHPTIESVIERIRERSQSSRQTYLARLEQMEQDPDSDRDAVGCSNLAHVAAGSPEDKQDLLSGKKPNIGIITAYNDMLSAHQPYGQYPPLLKAAIRESGATAQVASGVPAMCDGITQGRPGMELSLASRDVIAQSTAIGLSHGVFDSIICLGICDKIVPGLVIGALSHGHIPMLMIPSGPMASGLANPEKAAKRKAFAKGEITRAELIEVESQSYHSPGTCTFYGTANSNQMLMEMMGLHLPGSAFAHPHSDLRQALTIAGAQQAVLISRRGERASPIGRLLDERSFVNAIIGLHATGGSTNHTLHLPAMAAAGGIDLRWEDFETLSDIVPLLTRIYPNGEADVNHFQSAGGMGFIIRELLESGLLDGSAKTVWGESLSDYAVEPKLGTDGLDYAPAPEESGSPEVLRGLSNPHQATGGLKMLSGNIGKGVIKISAVDKGHWHVKAKAKIFEDESSVKQAFEQGKLDQDTVIVVRNQGPRANGMPELHSLTPLLSALQDKGHQVALVTDGRMSGASGKVPSAIHLTPEAEAGGGIAKIKDGDVITLDAERGVLMVEADLESRKASPKNKARGGFARELFADYRASASSAEQGGGINQLKRFKERH